MGTASRKPRNEERQIYCGKCKRLHDAVMLVGVPIQVTIAAMRNLRCPRCNAHKRHLEFV